MYMTPVIWNIFFHMYLDKDSHSMLVEQSKKLIGLSDSFQHWNTSSYRPFIKMCTEYTLVEVWHHWALYVDLQDLPHQQLKAIRDTFTRQSKWAMEMLKYNSSMAHSSGPLVMQAKEVTQKQFTKYWLTGTTFSDLKQVTAATLLNSTFVYSLGGEGCSVHYGIDPIAPFHLAALFGNAKHSVTIADTVKAAKAEFNDWCTAFHASISSTSFPVIHFILGEATAICNAL